MTRVLVGKLDASARWHDLGFASVSLNQDFRRFQPIFCSLRPGFSLYFANGRARFSHGGLVIPPEPQNFGFKFPASGSVPVLFSSMR